MNVSSPVLPIGSRPGGAAAIRRPELDNKAIVGRWFTEFLDSYLDDGVTALMQLGLIRAA
jgi:hypothetical protein